MAAARTVTIECAECGRRFRHKITGDGGRPPKFCEEHRVATNKAAKAKRGRDQRKGEHAAKAIGHYYDAARLAVALRRQPDVRLAAQSVGLDQELQRVEQLARAAHKDLISNDAGGRAARLHDTIDLANIRVQEALHVNAIPDRDLATVAARIAQLLELVGGKGKAHNFTKINVSFEREEKQSA